MNQSESIPLFIPDIDRVEQSNMFDFIKYINTENQLEIKYYDSLYDYSINHIEEFWEAVWKYADIIHSEPYRSVLEYDKLLNIVSPGAKWFPGSRLNFAENLLRNRSDDTALISYNENKETQSISYNELYDETSKLNNYLKNLGIQTSDRVAALTTNIPEAVIGMVATTSLGAIWSSTSPDFGLQGIIDRFQQIAPKVLIAVDGYNYNGKAFSTLETINKLIPYLPENFELIIINKIHSPEEIKEKIKYKFTFLSDILASIEANEIEFEQLPFDHPVYIMYSSGTTGKPKCIVHGAGGTLLQHYKELKLHTDLKKEDTISFFTTCGWMMWNWLVSSLMIGSKVFLYDGSPAYPNLSVLWDAIDRFKINIFGTSPKFLTSCQQSSVLPKDKHDLSSLKTILSTGSPLSKNNFEWVYSSVKETVLLSSIAGGTDIISCFMLGNPMLPVFSEEIQCRGLGMAVEAWDDNGKPLIDFQGELVCTRIFPSMPVYFWNDESSDLYKYAYFNHFENVWRHGDYIKITKNGGVVVYGRSDATLNPGGVRIGTAEIYRVLENIPEISDSLAVGLPQNNDVIIILFVVLNEDFSLNTDLESKIRSIIKQELTPRHLPKFIRQISEIPVTLNGKKVETAVTKILTGQQVSNKDSLLNPKSLEQFENLVF